MEWRIPRETVERVGPVTVTDGAGNPVAAFDLALIGERARPAPGDWTAAVGGYLPARSFTPGVLSLWARYASGAETVVLEGVGRVVVT